jgi:uncharacterized protein (TIGR02594 family)
MVQLVAFRRSLRVVVALVLCSAAMAAFVTPASARSHHGAGRHAGYHHSYHHYAYHHRRHFARRSRWDASIAQLQSRGFADTQASIPFGAASAAMSTSGGFGSSDIVSEARRYIGGNPTGRASLWCARFMNMVLQRSGHQGTGSDLARSFASYGQRISGPQVGAIAVMGRRGGGHVGIISGIDANGNPIMVSGNNRNRVVEAPISRGRIYAYVMPTG